MPSLPNYLRFHRKLHALTQEEVAFLLGINGALNRGVKTLREENFIRTPNLETALMYEAIYGVPVRELFAGRYEHLEQAVAKRAKLLRFRKLIKPTPERENLLNRLASKLND
jgi:transcriptional regulator with XRE-family HTH domain